jgi:hypothetical protein
MRPVPDFRRFVDGVACEATPVRAREPPLVLGRLL